MNPIPNNPDDDDITEEDVLSGPSETDEAEKPIPAKEKEDDLTNEDDKSLKSSINDLQIQLLQEKINQQRELYAAQMDLVRTIKDAIKKTNSDVAEAQLSYVSLLSDSNTSQSL